MPFTFTSPTSFVSNHIGYFAERMQKVCKSLFFGGVTTRFPDLNIAFFEVRRRMGSHAALRHRRTLGEAQPRARSPPTSTRRSSTGTSSRARAPPWRRPHRETSATRVTRRIWHLSAVGGEPDDLDEFRAVDIQEGHDIWDRFVPRFFFGCEADDRTVAFAFSHANAFGAKLQPILSSDISHWDVDEMADVVANSFRLVQKGILSEDQYEDFVCRYPFRLFSGANPEFFDGTAVAAYAQRALTRSVTG